MARLIYKYLIYYAVVKGIKKGLLYKKPSNFVLAFSQALREAYTEEKLRLNEPPLLSFGYERL